SRPCSAPRINSSSSTMATHMESGGPRKVTALRVPGRRLSVGLTSRHPSSFGWPCRRLRLLDGRSSIEASGMNERLCSQNRRGALEYGDSQPAVPVFLVWVVGSAIIGGPSDSARDERRRRKIPLGG